MTDHRVRNGWSMAVLAVGCAALVACAAPAPAGSAVAPNASVSTATSVSTVGSATAASTTVPQVTQCPKGALPTLTPGTLTIGTASPTTAPWYVGDSPGTGQGLESAMAYAVANELGYRPEQVAWTSVDRAGAAAGTVGGFDIDLNQFTAPDSGTATADYSTGYFSVTDTLVMPRAATAAPTSIAAAKGLELAAVAGSPAAAAGQRVTGTDPQTFASEQEALAGVTSGQVAGVVLPTPAALAAVAVDPALLLVGQLPTDPRVQPDQFKVLLAKGSVLTGCVSAAVDRLRVEGNLEQLAHQWIDPQVPELR